MKNCSRRMPLLVLSAFVALLVGSCKAVEAMGLSSPGYQMEIRPQGGVDLTGQLLGIYIIVSETSDVRDALGEGDIGALLTKDMRDNYKSFRQYVPVSDGTWRLESTGGDRSPYVEFEEDESSIHLLVRRDLVEATRHSGIVIAQYASKPYEFVEIDDVMLKNKQEEILEVGRARLTRVPVE